MTCTTQAQNGISDKVYYDLVTDIIMEDTIVPNWRAKIIEDRVKRGTMTKHDSIKYFRIIKNSRLVLYNKKVNSRAKKALTKDLEETHNLKKHLSDKEVRDIVNKFPEDGPIDATLVKDRIEVLSKIPMRQDGHKFSSPIRISGNRFLVYHFNVTGHFNFSSGVVIFSVKDDAYLIEKKVVLEEVVL